MIDGWCGGGQRRARRARRIGSGVVAALAMATTIAGAQPVGAVDSGGHGTGATAAYSGAEGEYTGVVPHRLIDTRAGGHVAMGSGESAALPVVGRGGVPATGVSAVVLNVTGVEATEDTFLAVGPLLPNGSSVNVPAGRTVSNLVTTPVNDAGAVVIYNHTGMTHVVVDVVGYYASAIGTPGARFTPATPDRILDTRSGLGKPTGKLGQHETMRLAVKGVGGVPANATAVVLNLTVTDPAAAGFVTAWPTGPAMPTASNLNHRINETRAGLAIVQLPESGTIDIYCHMPANLVADVMGWYTEERVGDRGRFVPFGPVRWRDTRDEPRGPLQPQPWDYVDASGAGLAVALNVTSVGAPAAGFLSVAGADVPAPGTSNLNTFGGEIVANAVITGVSPHAVSLGGRTLPSHSYVVRAGVVPSHVVIDYAGSSPPDPPARRAGT